MAVVVPLLSVAAIFSSKLRALVRGRKGLSELLQKHYKSIPDSRKRILVHVASFGELEQAKPIIALIKEKEPTAHIHLTFFSPSGYENTIGKYSIPDLITYLPFDTAHAMRRFLDITTPQQVLFIRYDVWHTLANEFSKRNIETILLCATFDDQKNTSASIKALYYRTYSRLSKILAIRSSDASALLALGIDQQRVLVSGDTRFDQVIARKASTINTVQPILPQTVIDALKRRYFHVLVAGSTWPEDEELLAQVITTTSLSSSLAMILAPHEVDPSHLDVVRSLFPQSILLSEIDRYSNERIIIVDSIGKLFGLYRYGTIAYIGGGFGDGIHNTLEPAVWGVPVIAGPENERSKEWAELVHAGGGFTIANESELDAILISMTSNENLHNEAAAQASRYVYDNQGATTVIAAALHLE